MPESQTPTAAERTDALFDRYVLPKVALTVILAASLVGTWVTTTLNGRAGTTMTLAKWAFFVAMGVLTGGFVWKHLFVRPADLGEGAADYCAEMYDRFDRIATAAVIVLAVSGVVIGRQYLDAFRQTAPVLGYVTLGAVWLALALATTYRSGAVGRQFRSPVGLAALALALAVVVATAVAEVAMRGLGPVAAGVRVLHLLAFAVWIGGAVWNIFVAVPTGQQRPTVTTVRAAGEQLERFRWAVRFVIPTLFLTGLYQATAGLGTTVALYVETPVGLAVLAKLGSIGVLVVIFKLCPMWRACSPVEGVCELDEFGGGGSTARPSPPGGSDGDDAEVTDDD